MGPVNVAARTYAGEAAQDRAARRRVALVDAAFDRVAADGWASLRIEAICRAAGLNKRYFYESFTDLDAVAAAVTSAVADAAIDATLEALDPSLEEEPYLRRGVGALVGHLVDDPRRARVLFGAVATGDVAAAHRAAAVRRVVAVVADHGRSRHGLADDPAVDLAAAMLVGGTSQAVLDWLDGRPDVPRYVFVDELVAMWLALDDAAVARARGRRSR